MAKEQRLEGAKRPYEGAIAALHIFALVGIAVCQPLFEVLSNDATFFVARGSQRADIVLMTLGLVALLPLPFIAIEWVARLLNPRLGRCVHLFWIAGLTALIFLPLIKGLLHNSPYIALGCAIAGGALASFAYVRSTFVSSFLTMLSPAPLIFAALFLLNPSIAKLLQADSPISNEAHEVGRPASVVLIVFDELPITSLVNENGDIDSQLFPNFARLASESTWFPNATANHNSSELAVPAILSGLIPSDPSRLPIEADYPRNVFSLLRSSHRMQVWETFSGLSPDPNGAPVATPRGQRLSSLADDLLIIYGHVVLPEFFASTLPSLESKWGGFENGNADETSEASRGTRIRPRGAKKSFRDRLAVMQAFTDAIDDSPEPTLYFLHVILPHSPWEFLPTGEQYALSILRSPGRVRNRWVEIDWLPALGYQRHLLQLGATDSLLGSLLDKLKEKQIYDQALVIVIADHGVSFRVGEPVRTGSPSTIRDIANVPLFVKLPFQHSSERNQSAVEAIDVLPTIADVLEIDLRWELDGFSVFDKNAPDRPKKTLYRNNSDPLVYDAATVLSDRSATNAKKALFPQGHDWERIYRMGPRPDLLTRQVDDLKQGPALPIRVAIMDRWRFDAVDTASGTIPVLIRGELFPEPSRANEMPNHVAVAINGRITGVAATHRSRAPDSGAPQNDKATFAVVVNPDSFQAGFNSLDIYGVLDDSRLASMRGISYEIQPSRITSDDGRSLSISPDALKTEVSLIRYRKGILDLAGWAYDEKNLEPADSIMVFEDGRHLLSTPLNKQAPELQELLGRASSRAGFWAKLPVQSDPSQIPAHVRIFAIRGSTATEVSVPTVD